MTTLSATVSLREAATFDATADSGHSVVLDSPEVSGGGNNGFRPLEMLLVGVGGCAGMVGSALLRRLAQDVTGYEVKVQGARAETHPMVFTDIAVEHVIEGRNLAPGPIAQALTQAASKYCPVVIMVGQAAKMTHTYRLVDTASGQEHAGTLAL
jgi:putative redox protein